MTRPARVRLDLQALQHNLQRVRQCAPQARIMAVVKANAYGHGAVNIARALGQVDALGVSCLAEALELRQAGIHVPIFLLEGIFAADELSSVFAHQLDMVVHNERQLQWLEAFSASAPAQATTTVWVKTDTGMGRLGFVPTAVPGVLARLRVLPWIREDIVLMSHLACADNPEDPFTNLQVQRFGQVCAGLGQCDSSLANSAGILFWPDTLCDWVRPGIMLYGISPDPRRTGADLGLQPVMTVSSEIIEIRHCQKGDGVGYSHRWVCPQDMPVGIVAFGYGDGYPRNLSVGTPVVVKGVRTTVVGRVSMDMLAVDLRPVPDAAEGDEVELWGKQLPVEQLAARADTIAYELVCRLSPRVQRNISAPADSH